MRLFRYILLLGVVACMTMVVKAQNATFSPYSRYALGELDNHSPAAYKAMGEVGFGMRSNRVINSMQPASFTACDSLTFMCDISAHASWTQYMDANGKRNKPNGNLDYFTMQFPLWKQNIAMSLGILPYSSVGYDVSLSDSVAGNSYVKSYSGEGGITDLYVGLSGNICGWVALGVNMYYMFGDVTNTRTVSFSSASVNDVAIASLIDVSSLRFRYGLQFFHTFADHRIVLGGVFEHKCNLKNTYVNYSLTEADTVESVIVDGINLPTMFGVGLSYTWKERLTLAFDYERQYWSDVAFLPSSNSNNIKLSNRNRFAFGLEYRHNPMAKNYAGRMFWRLGCTMSDSYISSVVAKDMSVSLGMGFPLRTSGTMFNVALVYGHRGSVGSLEENYLKLTLNAAIRETWFFKRKL